MTLARDIETLVRMGIINSDGDCDHPDGPDYALTSDTRRLTKLLQVMIDVQDRKDASGQA